MTLPHQSDAPTWPPGLPPQTRLQAHLHRPFRAQRTAIIAALANTPFPDERKAAERLAGCCSTAFVEHDPKGGQVRPWLPRCQSRLCPFCGRGRTARVADRVAELVATMTDVRHITLTYRANTKPLGDQVKQLRAAFSRFRRDPEVLALITGGVYSIEITRSTQTTRWHPHLHILAQGSYFPQAKLTRLWTKHMPGGIITWIRKVDDTKAAAWEIAKYVNKPPLATGWPPEAIRAYATATKGTRMLQTFGDLHGRKLPAAEEPPAEKPDYALVSIPRIAYLAAQDVDVAADLVALLWSRWPMLRRYFEELAPAACAATVLRTNPGLDLPRPPPLRNGWYGPHTDPDARANLDISLDMTMLLWESMDKARQLDPLPLDAEI